MPIPAKRRKGNGKALVVRGARAHNLKNIDVDVPARARSPPSPACPGRGKSTLVTEILYRALARRAQRRPRRARASTIGSRASTPIDKIIEIDQSPIGRTPRSNPATYTGLFGPIRELFAGVPEARVRGYKPGRFSFNVKGGRCENCKGDGILKIEMQFLPDVYVPCEVCEGKRYNREALEIHYKGRSIADVLEMTIEEALEVFAAGAADPREAADAGRRRARLHPPRPAGDDAVRRRGPAGQAGHRAQPAGDRQDRCTSSTSRRPGSTSPTSRSSSRCSIGSSSRATPCSSSSTTWT